MNNNVIIQTTSSNFPSFIENGCYYVDKTLLVKDIVSRARQVSLYTRPRRFGKSLNQSMLQAFFDVQNAEMNAHLFDNLAISSEKEICEKHQGKYPVIKLSFASLVMNTIDENFEQLFWKLEEGLTPFRSILNDPKNGNYPNQDVLKNFVNSTTPISNHSIIRQLTEFLHQYYGSKCVVLLDEYDVPLQTAFRLKYYDKMLPVVKSLMTSTFKDNPHLQYGVITGCLKVAKESIFTGFNNPYVNTILTNDTNGERFGFTQSEVDDMLQACDLWNCRDIVKEWYDGYRFGRNEVYNPFSVANFMDATLLAPDREPQTIPFWSNSSGNDILRDILLADTSDDTFRKMQILLDGGTVTFPIVENTVYRGFESNPETLWSTMLFTGYLKPAAIFPPNTREIAMEIPNKEVRQIIEETFLKWMKKSLRPMANSRPLLDAFLNGDEEKVQSEFGRQLRLSISCSDCFWSFYPAFLQGLLMAVASTDYSVVSNREVGEGIPDLILMAKDNSACAIMEIKSCRNPEALQATLTDAERQFTDRKYGEDDSLIERFDNLYGFAIACSRKQCMIKALKFK